MFESHNFYIMYTFLSLRCAAASSKEPLLSRHRQVQVPRDPPGLPQTYLLLNVPPHQSERALSILAPPHPLLDSVVGAVPADVNLAILPAVGARSVLEAVVPPALVNVAVLDFA